MNAENELVDISDSPSQWFKLQKNPRLFFWWTFHRSTTHLRVLPDFLIIGSMKGGTTSFFQYLAEHPEINPPFRKEIKYFDLHYRQGSSWYRAHFPLRMKMSKGAITGEATPYYMFHPLAPQRIAKDLPNIRLIALLRNPIDRAFSHYNHMVRVGRESLSFESALEQEDERLFQEQEKIISDPDYSPFNHLHYSYKARGRYIEQVETWLKYFKREQLLFLASEELYKTPLVTYQKALDFLGISSWEPSGFQVFKQGEYEGLSAKTRERLAHYFEPYNQRLYQLLDLDLGWK